MATSMMRSRRSDASRAASARVRRAGRAGSCGVCAIRSKTVPHRRPATPASHVRRARSCVGHPKEKSPRDLRLAGNRSSQPPSASRAQVLQATFATRMRIDVGSGARGLPRGVPAADRPARLAALPAAPQPFGPRAVRCGAPDRPCGSSAVRSDPPLRLTSTAWSEAKCTDERWTGQPRIPAGQCIYPQVTGLREPRDKV